MTIKIEKGIPLRLYYKYPFGDMEVGDSFFAENIKTSCLANAAHQYGTRHNMKFTCRKEGTGSRVWRIK